MQIMIETKTILIVALVVIVIAFLFFVINTIRCYLNKPVADDEDDEYRIQY